MGVNLIFRETFEASLAMSEQVLLGLGFSTEKAAAAVKKFAEYDDKMMRMLYVHRNDQERLVQSAKQYAGELERLFATDAENPEEGQAQES